MEPQFLFLHFMLNSRSKHWKKIKRNNIYKHCSFFKLSSTQNFKKECLWLSVKCLTKKNFNATHLLSCCQLVKYYTVKRYYQRLHISAWGMPEGIYILLVVKYPRNIVLISEKIFLELFHVIVDMTVKKCLKCQEIKMSRNLINVANLKLPI